MRIRAAILTISDTRSAKNDISGQLLFELLTESGAEVSLRAIIKDEKDEISSKIREIADADAANLILTTGGTGLAPRDVTPDATLAVIEREIPGIPEAMRIATGAETVFAMLSRGIAGVRGRTLVINLPGSPKAVEQCFAVIKPVLSHAISTINGGGHN